jgi:8-oxo-dGTP pyrophosphatase MutT (NUDIX family)
MRFSEYLNSDFRGAGFVFITPSSKVLILQKPNKKWCFVGGKREKGEGPLKTAKRECAEEIGFVPDGSIEDYFKHKKADENVDVYSFVMKVREPFVPQLNHEHIDYKWVKAKNLKDYNFSSGVANLIPILKHTYKVD